MGSLVYIVIPVYNVEKYLERCLDSVFGQTYRNIFVIAVDDGSTDNSLSILCDYQRNHKNILVIDKQNGGLSSARNTGLNAIEDYNNVFITFVDADDYIALDYIESLINIQKTTNADIVCSDYFTFEGERCEELSYSSIYQLITLNRVDSCKRLFDGTTQSHIPTKLYKGCIWKDIRFDESAKIMEDQRLTFKLFYKNNLISFTSYPGYYYFYNSSSLVRSTYNNRKIIDALDGYFEAVSYAYDDEDLKTLKKYAEDCFAAAYLMLMPRFSFKSASSKEKERFFFYKSYVKNNKIIYRATFNKKKNKKKRLVYLLCPYLYKVFYKIYLKKK